MIGKKEIIDYLKTYHTGAKNSIHYHDLAAHFHLDPRKLREIVSEIRQEGLLAVFGEVSGDLGGYEAMEVLR